MPAETSPRVAALQEMAARAPEPKEGAADPSARALEAPDAKPAKRFDTEMLRFARNKAARPADTPAWK